MSIRRNEIKSIEKRFKEISKRHQEVIDSLAFLDDIDVTSVRDEYIPAPFGRPTSSSRQWKKRGFSEH